MRARSLLQFGRGAGFRAAFTLIATALIGATAVNAGAQEQATQTDDFWICINCGDLVPFTGGILIYYHYFGDSDGDWYPVTVPSYDPPRAIYESGKLKLNAQGSTNCFGYWESKRIEVDGDHLYRAVFGVSAYVDTDAECPQFRLRMTVVDPEEVAYQGTGMLVVTSTGNGNYAPDTDPEYYEVYLRTPHDSDHIRLEFDLLSFDGVNDDPYASIRLEEVWVEQLD